MINITNTRQEAALQIGIVEGRELLIRNPLNNLLDADCILKVAL